MVLVSQHDVLLMFTALLSGNKSVYQVKVPLSKEIENANINYNYSFLNFYHYSMDNA